MNLETLVSTIHGTVTPVDQDLVERAYKVAEIAHRDHVRASGEPYIQHCLAVASILIELGLPAAAVAAGLLHDTVEDTDVTLEALERDFGEEVATLVAGVTKLTQLPRVSHYDGNHRGESSTKVELAKENLRKTFLAMGDDVRSSLNWRTECTICVHSRIFLLKNEPGLRKRHWKFMPHLPTD